MTVTHSLAMDFRGRAKRAEHIPQLDAAGNLAVKLLRTYTAQAEVFGQASAWWRTDSASRTRSRPSGRPSYRGECRPGGGAPVKTEDQAYALGYATGTTLPSPNPPRDALPVACDEERPLPNARRPISNQRGIKTPTSTAGIRTKQFRNGGPYGG
jgi:hypothetical protein